MIFLSIFFISLIATSHLANATGDDELKLSLTAASCNRNSKSKKSQETYKVILYPSSILQKEYFILTNRYNNYQKISSTTAFHQ